jgi:hypothetical protein
MKYPAGIRAYDAILYPSSHIKWPRAAPIFRVLGQFFEHFLHRCAVILGGFIVDELAHHGLCRIGGHGDRNRIWSFYIRLEK